MRFVSIGRLGVMVAFGAVLFTDAAQADVAPAPHHKYKLHLPQSFVSLLSTIEKPFAVSQPLAAPVATEAKPSNTKQAVLQTTTPVTSVANATQTVLHPLVEPKDEGFNFTGMTRQLPDATRSMSATDTAGLMSWTGKFN